MTQHVCVLHCPYAHQQALSLQGNSGGMGWELKRQERGTTSCSLDIGSRLVAPDIITLKVVLNTSPSLECACC